VDERVLRCARTPGKLGAPRLAEAGFSRLKGPPRAFSETAGRVLSNSGQRYGTLSCDRLRPYFSTLCDRDSRTPHCLELGRLKQERK